MDERDAAAAAERLNSTLLVGWTPEDLDLVSETERELMYVLWLADLDIPEGYEGATVGEFLEFAEGLCAMLDRHDGDVEAVWDELAEDPNVGFADQKQLTATMLMPLPLICPEHLAAIQTAVDQEDASTNTTLAPTDAASAEAHLLSASVTEWSRDEIDLLTLQAREDLYVEATKTLLLSQHSYLTDSQILEGGALICDLFDTHGSVAAGAEHMATQWEGEELDLLLRLLYPSPLLCPEYLDGVQELVG